MADFKIEHMGFCLDQYDESKCNDCPTELECLKMYLEEQQFLKVDELDPENNKVGC